MFARLDGLSVVADEPTLSSADLIPVQHGEVGSHIGGDEACGGHTVIHWDLEEADLVLVGLDVVGFAKGSRWIVVGIVAVLIDCLYLFGGVRLEVCGALVTARVVIVTSTRALSSVSLPMVASISSLNLGEYPS